MLRIMWNSDVSVTESTSSSQDTLSVHSEDFGPSFMDSAMNNLRHVAVWPSPFLIPKLAYDVELKLCKGNEMYEKSKKCLAVKRDMKMEILDKNAQAIFKSKATLRKMSSNQLPLR